MARPSKYKPEFAGQARKLCLLGATDRDLADFFSVTEQTINGWKDKHSEFFESIKEAKSDLDHQVVRRLFERATGYSHPEDKIFNNNGEPLIVPTTKHYAPDTTALIFWLKNRQPEQWRDESTRKIEGNVKHDHTVVSEETQSVLDELTGRGERSGDQVSSTH